MSDRFRMAPHMKVHWNSGPKGLGTALGDSTLVPSTCPYFDVLKICDNAFLSLAIKGRR